MRSASIMRLALLVFFLAAGVWLYSHWGAAARTQTPVSTRGTDVQTFDFGTAYVGDIVSHTFTIKNASGRPLGIAKVHADCACTEPTVIQGDRIPAGGSLDVPIQVRLSRESPSFGSTLRVTTDTNQELSFRIRGRVIDPLPTQADLGDILPGEKPQRVLYWRPVPGRTVRVGDVRSESDVVSVTYGPAPDNTAVTQFVITPRSDLPSGPFSTDIIVTPADITIASATRITVSGRVLRAIELDRETISVGMVPPNTTVAVDLWLRQLTHASILNVSFEGVGVSVAAPGHLSDFSTGHVRLPLELTTPSSSHAFAENGTVVVSLDNSEQIRLPFKIVGLVRPGSTP